MKTLDIEIANSDTASIWNDFVKSNPSSTPYHLWEYGESLSSVYGYRRFYLIAKRKDGEPVGVLPLIRVRSRLFGDKLTSLPFCEYGGPLSKSDDAEKELLKTGISAAEQLGVDYIEIRCPRNDISDFDRRYSKVQRYITFSIDLEKPTDLLWSSIDKKTRNAVRKAMKRGAKTKLGRTENLKEYYMLYLETQKRHGSPPNSFGLFSKLYELMHRMKAIRMLLATYRDRTIAGILLFHLNGVLYWWGNVVEPEYRSLNPTNLLLWKTMEWGHDNGFRILDLGRTRRETAIYHFKNGWSGQETNLRDYVCFLDDEKRELPDPEQSKYRVLSRLWSLMPPAFARRIGPRVVSGIGL